MNTISFTYRLTPEKEGFSVNCLDWEAVFSEGETIKECKENITEVTEMYLDLLISNKLNKLQYPKIKKHQAHHYNFQLTFNFDTGKIIDIEKQVKIPLKPMNLKVPA